MKKYIITCQTDPYHAGRTANHRGKTVLEYNGATPVKWIHDDNYGEGYTLEEARQQLDSYYREDSGNDGEGFSRKHFEMQYNSDIWIFCIEELIIENK